MDLKLNGRRAVITGAGSGIGRATAKILAAEGARVCLVGRTESTLQQTLESLDEVDGSHRVDVVDLFDRAEVATFLGRLDEAWHGVDVLVNNACSLAALRKTDEMTPDEWERFVGGNLRGIFLLCRGLMPGMAERSWGRVVNVGSLTAWLGASHYAEYATVKAGIEGFTRVLAVEYSRHGICANVIHPGFVRTERFEKAAPPEMIKSFARATSCKRLGKPEEVAATIAFLCSELAGYITGAVIPVGGGAGLNNLW